MSRIQPFDPGYDLSEVLLWQYNEAVRLQSLILAENTWYATNQGQFWTDWWRDVFNLDTANEFGLAVWARILNIPLAIAQDWTPRPVWGFDPHSLNFTRGNFGPDSTGVVVLTVEQRRLVLKLRAFQLVGNGTPLAAAAFLNKLFAAEGPVRVLDGLDMTVTYVFGFVPPSAVLFVLNQYDLLPRPAGVEAKILINPADSWGFAPYHPNFEHGNFGA